MSASGIITISKSKDYVLYEEEDGSSVWIARGEVRVTFKRTISMEDKIKVDAWLAQRGAQLVGYIPTETYQYRLDENDDLGLVLYCLKKMDAVWLASYNMKVALLGRSAQSSPVACYNLRSLIAALAFFLFIISAFFAIISRVFALMDKEKRGEVK
jgi:hypothetical protein